jgi:hypothetical protein
MKPLAWIGILLSYASWSALPPVSWERDTNAGLDRYAVEQVNGVWRVEKTSNFFDQKVDLRLGKLVALNQSEWSKVEAELKAIVAQLETSDRNLRAIGKAYNDLNHAGAPHSAYFKVGAWKVLPDSPLYPRLEVLVAKTQVLSLRLEEGVMLDQGRKNYVFYKQGTESFREGFNARFFCDSSRFPTRCLARQWGTLYLE